MLAKNLKAAASSQNAHVTVHDHRGQARSHKVSHLREPERGAVGEPGFTTRFWVMQKSLARR